MSRPHVTVAIPTLGRSPRLAEIVSSVAAADGTDEILLVRNGPGSRDAVSPSFPGGVRVLDLERPSLQAARNLAVAEASHGVVAFLDDDAVPEPGWLPALVDFVTRHPDFGAVGGPALLPGEYRVPAWMTPAALGYLGIVEYEPREIRCPPWRYPYGCNFAVRRDAVPAVGGFDMRIGYRGARSSPTGRRSSSAGCRRRGSRCGTRRGWRSGTTWTRGASASPTCCGGRTPRGGPTRGRRASIPICPSSAARWP
jgi:Predicted glycosyltransferases